jgi:integrase
MYQDALEDQGYSDSTREGINRTGRMIFRKALELELIQRDPEATYFAELNTDLTPHSLRHTHTSLLAEAGVSLEQIMDRLGHTDDHITKNVHLHVTHEMKKEASQKFSELMNSFFFYIWGQITSCRP